MAKCKHKSSGIEGEILCNVVNRYVPTDICNSEFCKKYEVAPKCWEFVGTDKDLKNLGWVECILKKRWEQTNTSDIHETGWLYIDKETMRLVVTCGYDRSTELNSMIDVIVDLVRLELIKPVEQYD